MKTHSSNPNRRTILAVAVLTALGSAPALAEEDEVAQLSKPESTISLGAGAVTKDNQRFGQYTGLEDKGIYGLLDLNVLKRDDETGTWFGLTGRNLGLDSRELRLEQRHQGDWGYFLEYNQIPRFSPYIINTAVQGIGTDSITNGSPASPHQDVQLSTERKAFTLGLDKIMGRGFDVQVRFKNEDKTGARLWGGETGNSMAFIPEPIDSTTRQLEATLGFIGDQLQLSGGYYGTMYLNRFDSLTITPAPASNLISPEPLPPSNQAHQLFLAGGYSFTPTTRSTFKVSYTKATQNENFVYGNPTGALLNSNSNPDARVDTTLAQVGLTARPLPKLSFLANLRYENRDDQTPEVPYVTASGMNLTNTVFSRKMTTGKIEASYQLPAGYRVTGGLDMSDTKRNVPSVRIVSWRGETDETSERLELRKSMSESVNGSLAYIHSNRTGSDYLNNQKGTTAYTTLLAPIIWADRDRDKIRLATDWTATEALSFQFVVEESRDLYSGLPLGPQKGTGQLYSIDSSYAVTEKWKTNVWLSRSETKMDQQSLVANATTQDANGNAVPTNTVWAAQLGSKGDSAGLGTNGWITGKMELGADYLYSYDRSTQDMSLANGAPLSQLPEIDYKLTRLHLFAKYALEKNAGLRVDIAHERRYTNDWTWSGFVYPQDGTTVQQVMSPRTTFIGFSAYYVMQ